MKSQKLTVISNHQVSERYWHMVVDSSTISTAIEPGQFFHIKCSEKHYPFLRRPFSIYRINEDTIEFLYLVKGLGTKEMTLFQEGEKVDVLGPLGQGFSFTQRKQSILLVARGVGIATLAALAQKAVEEGSRCIAILSARSRDDLLAADFLQGFGVEVYKVTEEDGTSNVENVARMMENIIASHDIDGIYCCGSKRLSLLSQRLGSKHGIQGEIALEEHMGCAMGACFACVCNITEDDSSIKSVRVCIEGPVFPLDKVVLQ